MIENSSPDIVLVPGSEAETVTGMADGTLIEWLQRVHRTSRHTVSACSGALILAAAGILRGIPATTHWIAQDRLKGFGVEARRNERIVRSAKVITAAGVSAGIDLALHLATELAGAERAQIIQLIIEYDPQPPHDSGHPSKATPAIYEAARSEMLERIQNRRNLESVPKVVWRECCSAYAAERAIRLLYPASQEATDQHAAGCILGPSTLLTFQPTGRCTLAV